MLAEPAVAHAEPAPVDGATNSARSTTSTSGANDKLDPGERASAEGSNLESSGSDPLEARAQAQRYFLAGVSLQKTDDFEAAITAYQTSMRLYPTKSALFNLANCQRAARRYADAWASLNELHRRFGDALVEPMLSTSKAQMAELENLTALLTIVSEPPGATVSIDGVRAGVTPMEAPERLTIGSHTLELRLDGHAPALVTVTLTPRQVATQVFRLESLPPDSSQSSTLGADVPLPPEKAPSPGAASDTSTDTSGDRSRDLRNIVGWTTLGVGVAALGMGTWFGTRALNVDRELAAVCDAGHCSANAAPRIERLERLTTATNVYLGLGAAMAAVGLTLVLWPSEEAPQDQVSFRVGPTGALLEGSF